MARRIKLQKLIAWLTLIFYLIQPAFAYAEVVVDPNAPTAYQPMLDASANGIPVVQITTPSSAGVSHNLYQQFNVDAQGLILNNSRNITPTQLGGYIDGNPFLAKGPARIILNEVTGNNPSFLRGYTEIAGQRAELVIANPNGIVGDGFGFINTSRAVLVTGKPIFGGNGSLEAFRVTGSQINIQGKGMDASTTDQADLISRSALINAGIWAQKLNVVTGANEVNHSNLSTTSIVTGTQSPQLAIDVGQLGGMYARKIYLVGTENGVGVNSQGIISTVGDDLTITNEGRVTLSGSTFAGGDLHIQARAGFSNQNTLYAEGNAQIFSQGAIENTGILAAQGNLNLDGQRIASSGTLAAGIRKDGNLDSTGDLTITAVQDITTQNKNLAAGNINMKAANINLANSTIYSGGNAAVNAITGGIDHSNGIIYTQGTLTLKPRVILIIPREL